jgi:hypothetical protein
MLELMLHLKVKTHIFLTHKSKKKKILLALTSRAFYIQTLFIYIFGHTKR